MFILFPGANVGTSVAIFYNTKQLFFPIETNVKKTNELGKSYKDIQLNCGKHSSLQKGGA